MVYCITSSYSSLIKLILLIFLICERAILTSTSTFVDEYTIAPSQREMMMNNTVYIIFIRSEDNTLTDVWKSCTIRVDYKPHPLSGMYIYIL